MPPRRKVQTTNNEDTKKAAPQRGGRQKKKTEVPVEEEQPDYGSWTVAQLKAACKEKGLKSTGKKEELVQILNGGAEDAMEEEAAPVSKKRKSSPAVAAKKKRVQIKVDDACSLTGAQVHDDYDCMLNQSNIAQNNNKFYVIQLLIGRGKYHTWNRWGRVGEPGQSALKSCANLDAAIADFEKKFKDKTGSQWAKRGQFEPKAGKYTLIEMEHAEEEVEKQKAKLDVMEEDGLPSQKKKKAKKNEEEVGQTKPSVLEPSVQELLSLIFNPAMFECAMENFHLDLSRMPLGMLKKTQIQKGYEVLEEIEEAMKGKSRQDLETLTSRFYTLIPHDFGRTRPPLLNDMGIVKNKMEMLNVLADIEIAQDLEKKVAARRSKKNTEKKRGELVEHHLDSSYKTLGCGITPLSKKSQTYKVIHKYFTATKEAQELELVDVFEIDREGEGGRFSQHDSIQNRKLLWHGTNVAVVAAILNCGLRIMPHSGGRVGKGIYFASENSKSAGYVSPARDVGIMFLAEVALGKEHHIKKDDYKLKQAPKGFDSIVARGCTEPDPSKDTSIQIEDKNVVVPQGKAVPISDWSQSSFSQSEYLVYKESQVRLRYLLKIRGFDWG
eukprot:GILK01002252.1.p1 GENE.GILK01002252.1~~GILK01002252.1.p1  ORF type:complete len:618 (-),score=140.78 GILK01002252.1:102-1928(-)